MAKKAERRRLHRALNNLSRAQVADIVKQAYPGAKGARIDTLAKSVISDAHGKVSPRLPRKIPRG
jgi:hypothetical protein